MEIDYWKLAGLLLGSSVIVGIITSLINYYALFKGKKVDFQYNYRKYILEKRIKAYDAIENLIAEATQSRVNLHNSELPKGHPENKLDINPIHSFFIPKEDAEKALHNFYYKHHIEYCKFFYWYTQQLRIYVNAYFEVLFAADERLKKEGQTIENHKIEGLKAERFLMMIMDKINSQYFTDVKHLDDVDKFKKTPLIALPRKPSILQQIKRKYQKRKPLIP